MARSLRVSSQSVDNCSKADALGRLWENLRNPVDWDQKEIARLRAELSKTRLERDITKSHGIFCEGAAVKYTYIERHNPQNPVQSATPLRASANSRAYSSSSVSALSIRAMIGDVAVVPYFCAASASYNNNSRRNISSQHNHESREL